MKTQGIFWQDQSLRPLLDRFGFKTQKEYDMTPLSARCPLKIRKCIREAAQQTENERQALTQRVSL